MLVVISDIHLTDSSTAHNVHASAWDLFQKEILSQIKADDQEVYIVLLGDIFDFMRTDYWFRKNIPLAQRPWGGTLNPQTGMNSNTTEIEKQFREILAEILETDSAKAFVAAINNIATQSGRPSRISYVIGNHDKVLNNFKSLKETLSSQFSAFTTPLNFCAEIREPKYGVYARHGHEWDEENYSWHFLDKVLNPGKNYKQFDEACCCVMSIGEVITAELMSGLIYRLKQTVDSDTFMKEIMDVNNIRPMLDVLLWLEWFSRNKQLKYKDMLMNALRESIDSVLQSDFAKKWDDLVTELWLFKGDITDRLSTLASYIRNKDFDTISSNIQFFRFFEPLLSSKKDAFVEAARAEFANMKADDDIQYILFGHTHEARHDYFSSDPSGKVKLYINTGTFLPLITRTENGNDFMKEYQMLLACFHAKSEDRKGSYGNLPTLDMWNGIKRKNYDEQLNPKYFSRAIAGTV